MENRLLILMLAEYMGVFAVVMLAGLSPAFSKRRPLIFKYPRREGVVALSLAALTALVAFILVRTGLQPYTPDPSLDALWQRLILSATALLAYIAALAVRRQPLLSVGWNRALLGPALRLALTLVFLTLFLRGQFMTLFTGITREEGLMLISWLGIALVEETIFRGYIQLRLSSWLGSTAGWLVTALLFLLWQLPFLLAQPDALAVRLAVAAAQAIVLGWIMRKSGHVLAPALYRAISEWVSIL